LRKTEKKINFFDPEITHKKKLVDNKFQLVPGTNIPLPSEVEISESGTCNRVCSFCPRSDPNYLDIKEFINPELHKKLCTELAELNFSGTLRYSGFVEPLLDVNIFNLLKDARTLLKEANLAMVTNGDVLNTNRLMQLFQSGLNKLFISVYDGSEDVKKFIKMRSEAKLTNEEVIIRDRTLPIEKDFGLTISNRAGMLKNAAHKILPLNKKLNHPCYYPGYTFFMDYNGDVLMCAHDWGKKRILGNLNRNSFIEIWLSQIANISRKKLSNGDRGFSPCNVCDVHGTLIGEKHSKAWKEILQ
jgi:radical SAM protein with 4Fe4S-binding SPASM domain